MRILRRILGPSNAIILSIDQTSEATEDQILEIRKYYHFVKLTEIVNQLVKRKNPLGWAAVTLQNPRKNLFLSLGPFLVGERIPFTLFLRPDCVGLNRLPPEEELKIFFQAYPEKLKEMSLDTLIEEAWHKPSAIDSYLLDCRKSIGPLPIATLDPGQFFVTWGKIVEIPPTLSEFGLCVFTGSKVTLKESVEFLQRQTGQLVTVGFSRRTEELAPLLMGLGLNSLLTLEAGVVTEDTDPWRMPVWSPGEKESQTP